MIYWLMIIVNILALITWVATAGYAIHLFYMLRFVRIGIEAKRDVVVKVVLPIMIMTIFYLSLLIVWIILDYDKAINIYVSFSWSVFHIATPFTYFLYVHRELKNIEKLI